jgi:hypothetical protein
MAVPAGHRTRRIAPGFPYHGCALPTELGGQVAVLQLDADIISTTPMSDRQIQHSSAYSADDATGSLLHQPMAVERRERRLRGNLIRPESGVVLNTRPVEAQAVGLEPRRLGPCRHLHLQSGPSGRRFAARASLPSGQCLCCQDRHDHSVPALGRAPRSWPESGWHPKRWARSGGSTTGHDRGGGRPAGSGRRRPDRGRGTGRAYPPPAPGGLRPAPTAPIELGQHLQRLPPGRQAKAARPASRSRRSSARSGV